MLTFFLAGRVEDCHVEALLMHQQFVEVMLTHWLVVVEAMHALCLCCLSAIGMAC